MARRSKEELIAELRRGFRAVQVFSEIHAEEDPENGMRMLDDLPDIDAWISGCLAQGGTLGQLLAGVMEEVNGYLVHFRTARHAQEVAHSQKLLARYKEKTGQDFLAQFADPLKTVKSILRRGIILHEADYRIVMEILNDTTQTTYDDGQIAKLNSAVSAFEASCDGRG